jgi:hypothetical protein
MPRLLRALLFTLLRTALRALLFTALRALLRAALRALLFIALFALERALLRTVVAFGLDATFAVGFVSFEINDFFSMMLSFVRPCFVASMHVDIATAVPNDCGCKNPRRNTISQAHSRT